MSEQLTEHIAEVKSQVKEHAQIKEAYHELVTHTGFFEIRMIIIINQNFRNPDMLILRTTSSLFWVEIHKIYSNRLKATENSQVRLTNVEQNQKKAWHDIYWIEVPETCFKQPLDQLSYSASPVQKKLS